MTILRTPDARFENLSGFDFKPRYAEDLEGYEGIRVHYLDEGDPNSSEVFLCLHGQPSWCYLYRKMIPRFIAHGGRVVAPDLIGFGRSDKPTDDDLYTFDFHRNMLIEFIKRMDLRNITLVCQDWGGILGLTIPMEMPERFSRLIVMNTSIPIGKPAGKGFEAWKEYNRSRPDLDIAALFKRSSKNINQAEADAYAAPFPDINYKSGVRRFPELVMVAEDMPGVDIARRAQSWWSEEWAGLSFMAVGMQDPVLGPKAMSNLRKVINGCPPPLEIENEGHFVQESGELVATAALAYFSASQT